MTDSKKNIIWHYARNQDGATAVEFALISMVFIFFVFGIMEAGRVMWTYNALQYGIENAARFALVTEDATETQVLDVAREGLTDMHIATPPFAGVVSYVTEDGQDFVRITGTYTYTPYSLAFMPESWSEITLTGEVNQPLNFIEEDEG